MNKQKINLVSFRKTTSFLVFFSLLSFSPFSSSSDPDSGDVIRSGIEIFSLVEEDLEDQGLSIKSVVDMTARIGCEGAFHIVLNGEKKRVCAGGEISIM